MEKILFALLIIVFGAICLFKPEMIWELYAQNKSCCGPSRKYTSTVKAAGVMMILIGIIIIVVTVL